MKKISQNLIVILLLGSIIALSSCSDKGFGIFSSEDGVTAIMNGDIKSRTPKHWDNFIAEFPNINRIVMKDCPGSSDDEANVEVARKVHNHGVSIHLPSDAVIASGAVDFFLAGTTRTRDAGSQIGVHSWSDGNNEATDFPVGSEEHNLYIDYYKEMGFSQEEAEAFYYFTINAAPAAGIHWMTDGEIEQYKLLTE